MKRYLFFSLIVYSIIGGMLFRNYSFETRQYDYMFHKLPTLILLLILGGKFSLDIGFFFLKKHRTVIQKLFFSLVLILLILFVIFIPSSRHTYTPNKLIKQQMGVVNKSLFYFYKKAGNKIPSEKQLQNIKQQVEKLDSPFFSRGKQLKYKINYIETPQAIVTANDFPPGTIFVTLYPPKNYFAITAVTLDPETQKPDMLLMRDPKDRKLKVVVIDVILNQTIMTIQKQMIQEAKQNFHGDNLTQ